MKLTITGPRSVGKTTITKVLAKKLEIPRFSSDEIGEEHFKEQGGLDKAIKSGAVDKFIKEEAYILIRSFLNGEQESFVFDLSGGAISSRKYPEITEKIRETAKKNSTVIGLLPSEDIKESIKFLFKREKEREHFKELNLKELFKKVYGDYRKFPPILEDLCNFIVYVNDKSAEEVADEILEKLR